MKNIHVIAEDKPSRLFLDLKNNICITDIEMKCGNSQHICIISDEQIKINDYITDGYNVWQWKDDSSLLGRKKVILTTDQDLIKDGVQEIDDDFLEWFIKNSSCEVVEVQRNFADECVRLIKELKT